MSAPPGRTMSSSTRPPVAGLCPAKTGDDAGIVEDQQVRVPSSWGNSVNGGGATAPCRGAHEQPEASRRSAGPGR